MKPTLTLLLILSLSILSSCSSVITRDDCKKDMKTLGLEHGRKGLNKLTDEIRSVCINSSETVDLEMYENGFNMGWSTYCTPFNGFVMGRKGDNYKSFCPAEKEDLFHEKFLIGKQVYEKNDQASDLEERIKDLMNNVEKDPASAIDKETLKKYQEHLLLLKREIQALEQQGMSPVHTN